MEYLTIEEKSSLIGYLVLLDDQIKRCQSLGMSSEHWEELKENAIKALDKIKKNPSLEIVEMRKKSQIN